MKIETAGEQRFYDFVEDRMKKYRIIDISWISIICSSFIAMASGQEVSIFIGLMLLVFGVALGVKNHADRKALDKNIELLGKYCSNVIVINMMQVLNFEDEIVKSTDVSKAQDLTRSRSVSNFKSDFCRMKVQECRSLLERHQFDVEKIWVSDPPSAFKDLEQGATRIISVTTK